MSELNHPHEIIDKNGQHHTYVEKIWGDEHWFCNNEKYCGKIILCKDGIWSSDGKYHYHAIKDETFMVVQGELILEVENMTYILKENDTMRVLPNQKHRFKSKTEHCIFIEASTTHDEKDSYRIEK